MTGDPQFGFGFDRNGEIEARVHELLFTRDLKPFPITDEQRALLRILSGHKGAAFAITIAELLKLSSLSHLDARAIKLAARGLVVDYGLPVVGMRRPPYGYYLAITPDELAEAIRPLIGEIKQIARRVRALQGSDYVREMLGQIPIQLDQEEAS
jgi:predicted ArsR family transcriptional regulator